MPTSLSILCINHWFLQIGWDECVSWEFICDTWWLKVNYLSTCVPASSSRTHHFKATARVPTGLPIYFFLAYRMGILMCYMNWKKDIQKQHHMFGNLKTSSKWLEEKGSNKSVQENLITDLTNHFALNNNENTAQQVLQHAGEVTLLRTFMP